MLNMRFSQVPATDLVRRTLEAMSCYYDTPKHNSSHLDQMADRVQTQTGLLRHEILL